MGIVCKYFSLLMFPSSHFSFLVTFGDKVLLRNIMQGILQGKMGKTEKSRKENHATKVTKIPKTKRRKYGMNETFLVYISFQLGTHLFSSIFLSFVAI